MNQPFQDSSHSDQLNIRRALGLDDTARRKLWDGTRRAIETDGLTLGDEIGQGGFGLVFAARENATNRKLAIKVLDEPDNKVKREQFQRELQMLASESVPLHIVPHLRYGREGNAAAQVQPYLVMEQIDGRTVYEYAVENELSIARKIELAERVFDAFAQLHERGIVQGDPSPKNVMVEKGDRVRIVDFGGSRDLKSVIRLSQTRAGGTQGFSPFARLTGEEKASLWSDLFGASAVVFHLFTGKTYDQVEQTESSYLQFLRDVGVPKGVAAIIVKGLRTKDAKYSNDQDDPRLFHSATEMAEAITAWQRSQAWWREFCERAAIALLVAVPLLWFGFWSFGKYQELQHSQQQRAVSSLQSEVTRVTNSAHPAVRAKLAENEKLLAELHRAETAGELAAARDAQAKLIAAMRETLETSRNLERFIPLRESLGIVLLKMPWVMTAPTIEKEQARLLQQYEALGKQLDDGELKHAADSLTVLQKELAALAAQNIAAAAAEQARVAFKQENESVADRVRKLDGFQPVAKRAKIALEAWESGDFLQANKDFGQALQILTDTAPQLETPEETSNREAQQISQLRDAATSLRKQLTATVAERDSQLTRVRELEGQIAQAAKQNLDDRAALKAALARAEELSGKNKAGSTVLADLRNTIQQQAPKVAELTDLKPKHQAVVAERDELKRKLEPLQKQVSALEAAVKSQAERDAARATHEKVAEIANGSLPANGIGRSAGERMILKVKGIDVPFRWCPPDRFVMGSPAKETARGTNENQVSVTLTSGFWMLETECTQELWAAVMGSSPEAKNGQGPKFPVFNVSHDDCVAISTKLNTLLSGSNSSLAGWNTQLPTEAQWEYACRAGSRTRYCFGDSESQLGDYAWYRKNSESTSHPHPVGQKEANKWGLYDMHGNVSEWCATNWDADKLTGGTEPTGPKTGQGRVLRGGDWAGYAGDCRSACRAGFRPEYRNVSVGFRVVLAARTP